ncbi:MAG: acyl-CoA thioesterase [Flavisolibacter sp.]
MSRIKIKLPASFPFSTSIQIRITDINYGGHVGNDTILSLVHEARMQFLKHYGYSELDMKGVGMIMIDAGIEFKAELFYGDEITVFVSANEFTRIGFDLYYKIMKTESIVAIAKTAMVCYNYELKKVVGMPAGVAENFQSS